MPVAAAVRRARGCRRPGSEKMAVMKIRRLRGFKLGRRLTVELSEVPGRIEGGASAMVWAAQNRP
jgi:hypothetical protein